MKGCAFARCASGSTLGCYASKSSSCGSSRRARGRLSRPVLLISPEEVGFVPRGRGARAVRKDRDANGSVLHHEVLEGFGESRLKVPVGTASGAPVGLFILDPSLIQHVVPVEDHSGLGARCKHPWHSAGACRATGCGLGLLLCPLLLGPRVVCELLPVACDLGWRSLACGPGLRTLLASNVPHKHLVRRALVLRGCLWHRTWWIRRRSLIPNPELIRWGNLTQDHWAHRRLLWKVASGDWCARSRGVPLGSRTLVVGRCPALGWPRAALTCTPVRLSSTPCGGCVCTPWCPGALSWARLLVCLQGWPHRPCRCWPWLCGRLRRRPVDPSAAAVRSLAEPFAAGIRVTLGRCAGGLLGRLCLTGAVSSTSASTTSPGAKGRFGGAALGSAGASRAGPGTARPLPQMRYLCGEPERLKENPHYYNLPYMVLGSPKPPLADRMGLARKVPLLRPPGARCAAPSEGAPRDAQKRALQEGPGL